MMIFVSHCFVQVLDLGCGIIVQDGGVVEC